MENVMGMFEWHKKDDHSEYADTKAGLFCVTDTGIGMLHRKTSADVICFLDDMTAAKVACEKFYTGMVLFGVVSQ